MLVVTGNASNMEGANNIAKGLLSTPAAEISSYRDGDCHVLVDAITSMTGVTWMDSVIPSSSTSIREYMVTKLGDYIIGTTEVGL